MIKKRLQQGSHLSRAWAGLDTERLSTAFTSFQTHLISMYMSKRSILLKCFQTFPFQYCLSPTEATVAEDWSPMEAQYKSYRKPLHALPSQPPLQAAANNQNPQSSSSHEASEPKPLISHETPSRPSSIL